MKEDLRVIIAYVWILSVMGAFFLGNEWAMMHSSGVIRSISSEANKKINECHKSVGIK